MSEFFHILQVVGRNRQRILGSIENLSSSSIFVAFCLIPPAYHLLCIDSLLLLRNFGSSTHKSATGGKVPGIEAGGSARVGVAGGGAGTLPKWEGQVPSAGASLGAHLIVLAQERHLTVPPVVKQSAHDFLSQQAKHNLKTSVLVLK